MRNERDKNTIRTNTPNNGSNTISDKTIGERTEDESYPEESLDFPFSRFSLVRYIHTDNGKIELSLMLFAFTLGVLITKLI